MSIYKVNSNLNRLDQIEDLNDMIIIKNPLPSIRKNSKYINKYISSIPYVLEFNNELKNLIRKRDDFKCVICKITNEEHKKKFNCQLHIHHINYNKKDCRKNNLITLCAMCNSKVNFKRDKWKKYLNMKIKRLI